MLILIDIPANPAQTVKTAAASTPARWIGSANPFGSQPALVESRAY